MFGWFTKSKRQALAQIVIDKVKALDIAARAEGRAVNAELRARKIEERMKESERKAKNRGRMRVAVKLALAFLPIPYLDDAIDYLKDAAGGLGDLAGETLGDVASAAIDLAAELDWPALPDILDTLKGAHEVVASTAGKTVETLAASFSMSDLKNFNLQIDLNLERIQKLQNLA